MKTESEIANDAFLLLFDKPIENAILHESLIERLDRIQFLASIASRTANAMQKQIIDVIGLQELEASMEHILRSFSSPVLRCEVRHLGSDIIAIARITRLLQGCTCSQLGETFAISGTGVEIIHTMIQRIFHQLVGLFLIDGIFTRSQILA